MLLDDRLDGAMNLAFLFFFFFFFRLIIVPQCQFREKRIFAVVGSMMGNLWFGKLSCPVLCQVQRLVSDDVACELA